MPSKKFTEKKQSPKMKTNKKIRKKTKKKKTLNLLFVGLGLTGVALASATAGAILALSLSSRNPPLKKQELTPEQEAVFKQDEPLTEEETFKIPELTKPVNILLIGTKVLTSESDEHRNSNLGYHALVNSFKGLADTMLLLRFDPYTRKLTVLSIPRDTRTFVEGVGVTKINVANYFGGAPLSAKATKNLLGDVEIHRYVRVNIQAIEKLIDALGGVEVYVPKDMKYNDFSQHLFIDLKQGQQVLDGNKAIQFLRFRYDKYGDIGRVQRQQMLMRAVVEQTLQPTTLIKIPKIFEIINEHIDTNLEINELIALSGFAAKMKRSNVQMLLVPGNFSSDGKQEVSYWVPHRRKIREIMAQHFEVGDYQARYEYANLARVNVAIQDSIGNPQAVRKMVTHLREAGYKRVFVSQEDWREQLPVTRIIAQKGDDASAAAIRASLGVGEVLVESTGVIASDITIVIGEDWQDNLDIVFNTDY